MKSLRLMLTVLALLVLAQTQAAAQELKTSLGGTIYVPVYSHVFIGDKARPFPLSITLSLRNLNHAKVVSLQSVEYRDSEGGLIKSYLVRPDFLKPLASKVYTVPESDNTGGDGPRFVITWQASEPVIEPLAEAVMVGTSGQQGVSFCTRGLNLPKP